MQLCQFILDTQVHLIFIDNKKRTKDVTTHKSILLKDEQIDEILNLQKQKQTNKFPENQIKTVYIISTSSRNKLIEA